MIGKSKLREFCRDYSCPGTVGRKMFVWEIGIAVPALCSQVPPHPRLCNRGMRGQPGAGPAREDAVGKKAHFNLNAVNMLRVIWDKWDT